MLTRRRPLPLQAGLDLLRFVILFSMIIPISLRVALDMAKLVYKRQMASDRRMPGLQARPPARPPRGRAPPLILPMFFPQVRSTNLPEELGGIHYLLTDKT